MTPVELECVCVGPLKPTDNTTVCFQQIMRARLTKRLVDSLVPAAVAFDRSDCGMTVSETRRLRELEAGNGELKRLLADAELDKSALKDLLGRN